MASLFDNVSTGHTPISQTFYNDPRNRHVKVIALGAGVMGMINAYNIQKHCSNVELVVYEKNADIGGTWFENRYPGCACDVPSHSYSFHFAPNPDWPKFLSKREDIWTYLDRICNVFGLRSYMKFNTRVVRAEWNEDTAQWHISLELTNPDGSTERFEDTCDLFLFAPGVLNNWKMPEIEGLETFKGRIIHTADWPQDFQREQWTGKNMLVIGSGASSLQIVPNLQPVVEHLDIFVRTGVWFAPLNQHFPDGYTYSEEQKVVFRNEPQKLIEHIKLTERELNLGWPGFYKGGPIQAEMRKGISERMAELIQDPHLLKGFTPKFAVGCRRITPGEPYLRAIQEDNVDVHFTGVTKITPDGVVGADGQLRKGDTLICATGFDVSFRPRFPIIGRGGVDLRDLWDREAFAYLGLAVPHMPNLLMLPGPPVPVQNGTPFGTFHAVAAYALRTIEKLQTDNIRTFEVKEDITKAFKDHCGEFHESTVFTDSCRSWYKNNETGRVHAVWPGSAVQYLEVIKTPRWEHYQIDYRNPANIFAFLGNGLVKQIVTPGEDPAYYLTGNEIDPLWLAEVQKPVLA